MRPSSKGSIIIFLYISLTKHAWNPFQVGKTSVDQSTCSYVTNKKKPMWQLVHKEGNHSSPCSGTQNPPNRVFAPASFHPQAKSIVPLLGPTTFFAQYNMAEVSAEPQNPSSSVSVLSEHSPQTGMDGS